MTAAPFCPAPDRYRHPPGFAIPPAATDYHAHMFEAARYGYQNDRSYTAPDLTIN